MPNIGKVESIVPVCDFDACDERCRLDSQHSIAEPDPILSDRQLVGRPAALRSDRDQTVSRCHASPPRFGRNASGQDVDCRDRTSDFRQPDLA